MLIGLLQDSARFFMGMKSEKATEALEAQLPIEVSGQVLHPDSIVSFDGCNSEASRMFAKLLC